LRRRRAEAGAEATEEVTMHFRKLVALLAIFLVLTRPLPEEPPEAQAAGAIQEVSFGASD